MQRAPGINPRTNPGNVNLNHMNSRGSGPYHESRNGKSHYDGNRGSSPLEQIARRALKEYAERPNGSTVAILTPHELLEQTLRRYPELNTPLYRETFLGQYNNPEQTKSVPAYGQGHEPHPDSLLPALVEGIKGIKGETGRIPKRRLVSLAVAGIALAIGILAYTGVERQTRSLDATPTPTYAPPTATATATAEPSPTATGTPTEISRYGTPEATPIQTRFENGFWLSSPYSETCMECNIDNFTTPKGSKWVIIKQPPESKIPYSGEKGYYVAISPTNADYVYMTIFDRSGYALEYIVSNEGVPIHGAALFGQGSVSPEIKRGDPIAVSKGNISVLNANYAVSLKWFPEKVVGGSELQRAAQTPYEPIEKNDFMPRYQSK